MTKLSEIVDIDLFNEMLTDGYIRTQTHPDYPEYHIYNYTEQAAYERVWNAATLLARGLIVDYSTNDVIARPFAKFFNFDESEAPSIAWDQKLYHWSNKEDGSLGILYSTPHGMPAIATRGSFASDQALHATAVLRASGLAWVYAEYMDEGYTPLFEIVYPENRIVLDYGKRDELIHLGFVHIKTGAFIPPTGAEIRTFGELATDLSRPNSEGWVAWVSAYKAVKIKQPDYVALHRIVTGLNRKSIWRALSQGEDVYAKLAAQLPDELYKWADGVADELRTQYRDIMVDADGWYVSTLDQPDVFLSDDPGEENESTFWAVDRKVFAQLVKNNVPQRFQGYMFSLLDGRDIQDKVWKSIEPVGGDK